MESPQDAEESPDAGSDKSSIQSLLVLLFISHSQGGLGILSKSRNRINQGKSRSRDNSSNRKDASSPFQLLPEQEEAELPCKSARNSLPELGILSPDTRERYVLYEDGTRKEVVLSLQRQPSLHRVLSLRSVAPQAGPTSFDAEMQRRGLKEGIRTIESFNAYLESGLGSSRRNADRNSVLAKNVSGSSASTRATVKRGSISKESVRRQPRFHVRSASNLIIMKPVSWREGGKRAKPARILFPYQRRRLQGDEPAPAAKNMRSDKKSCFRGPVSPVQHFRHPVFSFRDSVTVGPEEGEPRSTPSSPRGSARGLGVRGIKGVIESVFNNNI